MAQRPTLAEAREILDVGGRVDGEELTRRYRRLARRLHPDAGGDPSAFHRLQAAYELLRREAGGAPRVGAPPRRGAPGYTRTDAPEPVDLDSVDWQAASGGAVRLNRERLALRASRARPVAPTLARSRGPRSLLNPLVRMLSPDLSSVLVIRPETEGVGVALEARTGQMRGRLLDAPLPGRWTRTQENRTVTAACRLVAQADPRVNALRATEAALELLEALSWPPGSWRLERQPGDGA